MRLVGCPKDIPYRIVILDCQMSIRGVKHVIATCMHVLGGVCCEVVKNVVKSVVKSVVRGECGGVCFAPPPPPPPAPSAAARAGVGGGGIIHHHTLHHTLRHILYHFITIYSTQNMHTGCFYMFTTRILIRHSNIMIILRKQSAHATDLDINLKINPDSTFRRQNVGAIPMVITDLCNNR